MKRLTLLIVAVLLAACSKSPAGPAGIDPTVLITNQLTVDTVFFTWRDGQGIVGSVVVPPGHEVCAKFLAQPDSAYFEAIAAWTPGYPQPAVSTYTAPWFNPSDHPAFTMTVTHTQVGSPDFAVYEVQTEPC